MTVLTNLAVCIKVHLKDISALLGPALQKKVQMFLQICQELYIEVTKFDEINYTQQKLLISVRYIFMRIKPQ